MTSKKFFKLVNTPLMLPIVLKDDEFLNNKIAQVFDEKPSK